MGEAVFDTVDPPQTALIDKCVHCGFCLPSCPTYMLWGEEMDSPRGRIYLMKAALDGRTPITPSFVQHFDACLGCMACVTACPSGVQYDKLIESTRAQVERRFDRPTRDSALRNAIFRVFPYPKRLHAMRGPLRLYQKTGLPKLLRGGVGKRGPLERLSPTRAAMESLAPPLERPVAVPARTPAHGRRRGAVGML